MANEKRLIDANFTKAAIQNYIANNEVTEAFVEIAGHICGMLDDCETVDAVPVVHAHWEDGCAIHNGKEVYKSIDCSHCNEIFKIESHDREYWKKRFKVCPFCGAVMDGGNEDV